MAAKKQAAAATESRKPSGLGLGSSMGDLSGLLNQPSIGTASDGLPLELPIDMIDEDPNQPRHEDSPGFSKQSLGELADTIRERKVKSPISVRPHPEVEGRYMINHGARRYRASIIAERTTIPAYIDPDYTEADQVIENLQRNDLTPREIADWIGRELARGKKKRDIAKELGKSPAFVTQHVTLLDLPEPVAEAFTVGRVSDVTVINELVKAHKQAPEEVAAWMDDDTQDLTRGSVKLLREFLDDKQHGGDDDPRGEGSSDDDNEGSEPKATAKKPKVVDPDKLKKAIVVVKHEDMAGRLLLDRRPSKEGMAWIKYETDGQEVEVDLLSVELVAVMEA